MGSNSIELLEFSKLDCDKNYITVKQIYMIKIDFKKFVTDRMWFGWWHCDNNWIEKPGWRRYHEFHWTIIYRFNTELESYHEEQLEKRQRNVIHK